MSAGRPSIRSDVLKGVLDAMPRDLWAWDLVSGSSTPAGVNSKTHGLAEESLGGTPGVCWMCYSIVRSYNGDRHH